MDFVYELFCGTFEQLLFPHHWAFASLFSKIMPVLGNLLWGRWALLKMTDASASKS